MRIVNATAAQLANIMSFDHVIRVDEDGTVSDGVESLHAPDITMYVDENGQDLYGDAELIRQAQSYRDSWEMLGGFTGQQGYRGVVLHSSEVIGGGLADHILNTPGYYVAVVIECEMDTDDASADLDEDLQPAGWAVCFREL